VGENEVISSKAGDYFQVEHIFLELKSCRILISYGSCCKPKNSMVFKNISGCRCYILTSFDVLDLRNEILVVHMLFLLHFHLVE
jgi:hypothetical protein